MQPRQKHQVTKILIYILKKPVLDPIVRVDGDVHADEAEENKLPGGLNPSSKL